MHRYASKASLAAALAVAFASVTPLAHAQGQAPKYKRNSPKITVKVEQTERTAGLREKPKAKAEAKAPEITADAFMDIETAVKGIRAAQVEEYRALIEDTDKKDPQLPDLLFRLAELYAQQQRYWRFRAMEMYSKIDKAKGGKKASLQSEQKKYFGNEAKYLKEAIKVYATLANNDRFKNYPRMDEALFYYAYTLQGAKKVDLSRVVYQKLIKDYPGSKFIPYAYLAFADYFFEQNDLDKADKFYDKVLEFPKSAVYLYAYYKKGWVYLNQKREQDALAVFFEVSQKTQGKKKYADINKASKKDFVRAYAVVGQPKLALKAFERVDKDYAFNMLKILAGIYLDQGKAEKSIYTHRELIGLAPKDQQVCEWEYNVVQAMMGVGTPKDKTDETETLVKLYLKYKEKKLLKGTALEECGENARATTSELARVWHNEAVKTLNYESLGNVERLYQLYVESFPDAKDIGEIQFYYSELLWTRAENESNPRVATDRWEKAAMAFTDVVKRGNTDPEKKKEAAYAAVLGWKNALAVDPRTQVAATEVDEEGTSTKPPEPKPIGEREQKMIAAFDVYIKYIKDPKDPELVMMKFLKARIYWRHDHLEESLPMFEEIVDKHLDHETGEYSVNIILDSLIRMNKYAELNEFADKISKKREWLEDKDEIKTRIADIRAITKRKMAQQLEKSGDHVKCGEAYYDIYKDNPKGPKMDEVLYNAGVCYEDGRSIGLAIAMFNILQKEFPKSSQAQKALVRIGNAYGAAAFYDKAAQAYEEYAKKYGGEKDAAGALGNAVTYRKGVGDDKKAIENIEFFVKQYKNKLKKEAADALFGMVGIYEKQGNKDMVVKHLERYVREMGASGGRDRVVIAHAKIGQIQWEKSCRDKGVDGACVKIQRERAIRSKAKRRRGSALPERCGQESKIKLTVLKRNPSDVASAQRHFKTAISEFGKGAGDNVSDKEKEMRIAAATYWASAARFSMAEAEYEKFLSIEFPEGMDFNPANEKKTKESTKRFLKWKADKDKMGVKVNDLYSAVLGQGSAAWAIAAAARMAQISQNYADALYTAEVPKFVRSGPNAEDGWDAYCDKLTEVAAPLEERSVAGFSFCLEESTKRNWFNTWSKLCERELGQIRPQDFPTAAELHAEPTMVAPVTDTQGLVSSIRI
jgi:tetratricopeptide (TPR) repeat protein